MPCWSGEGRSAGSVICNTTEYASSDNGGGSKIGLTFKKYVGEKEEGKLERKGFFNQTL